MTAGRSDEDDEDDRRGPRTGCWSCSALLVIALIAGGCVLLPQRPVRVAARAGAGPEPDRHDRGRGPRRDRRRRAERRRRRLRGRARTCGNGRGDRAGPQPRPVRRPRHRGRPRGLVRASRMVEVPFLDRVQPRRRRRNRLRDARARGRQFESAESDEPKGQVLETDPARRHRRCQQGTVVTVTTPTARRRCPNVVGLNQAEAEEQIRRRRFEPTCASDDEPTEPRGHRHRPDAARRTSRRRRARRSRSFVSTSSRRPRRRPRRRRPPTDGRPRSRRRR